MINNKWFCDPDDYRESWCFIIFDKIQRKYEYNIRSWEIGYGNPNRLIQRKKSNQKRERKVIKDILKELNYCRKNNLRIAVINREDFKILRTRCIQLHIKDVSLKDISYLCLDDVVRTYFHFGFNEEAAIFDELAKILQIEKRSESKPERFRKILNKIGPLMPREAFDAR